MDETSSPRKDRVLIHESVLGMYQELRKEGNIELEQAPFETNKDIFMFAVCLGLQGGRRDKYPSGGSKSDIRRSVFSDSDYDVLKAIAIVDTGDVNVLANPSEILVIAEEYAYAGIYEIKAYLLNERGRPLWNLVDLVVTTTMIEEESYAIGL